MRKLVFLGPGAKLDVRARFGKDRPEYIFWSTEARQGLPGAEVDIDGNVAPWGEVGKAREVTNDEAEDLLSFPRQVGIDYRFAEVDAATAPVVPVSEVAIAAPRDPEVIRSEVERELAALSSAEVVAMEEPTVENKRRSRAASQEG